MNWRRLLLGFLTAVLLGVTTRHIVPGVPGAPLLFLNLGGLGTIAVRSTGHVEPLPARVTLAPDKGTFALTPGGWCRFNTLAFALQQGLALRMRDHATLYRYPDVIRSHGARVSVEGSRGMLFVRARQLGCEEGLTVTANEVTSSWGVVASWSTTEDGVIVSYGDGVAGYLAGMAPSNPTGRVSAPF